MYTYVCVCAVHGIRMFVGTVCYINSPFDTCVHTYVRTYIVRELSVNGSYPCMYVI